MSLMEKVKSALNWGIDDEYDEYEEVSERSERAERMERAERLERFRATDRTARDERADRSSGSDRFEKPSKKHKKGLFGDRDKKVVQIHVDEDVRVANLRLMTFEDARKVDMHLKLERTVLVDVSNLDKVNGQRSIDFICGIIEALEANIQKMPNAPIFVITPNGTSIVGDSNDEFKYKGVFPWIK